MHTVSKKVRHKIFLQLADIQYDKKNLFKYAHMAHTMSGLQTT